MNFLKRYWEALLLIAVVAIALDMSLSTLLPCEPIAEHGHAAVEGQHAKNCGYFHGPVFVSLSWFITFVDEHEGFFLVLFTGALVWVTAALWRSTDKLWAAGERQIAVAQTAAEAAKVSADITEKNFRHTHRPQMTYRISDIPVFKVGQAPTAGVDSLNVGGGIYGGGVLLGFDLISSDQFEVPIKIKKPDNKLMIWERNDPTPWKITFFRDLTSDDVAGLKDGKLGLNFWGCIVGKNAWEEDYDSTFSYIFTGDLTDPRFGSRDISLDTEEKKDENPKGA